MPCMAQNRSNVKVVVLLIHKTESKFHVLGPTKLIVYVITLSEFKDPKHHNFGIHLSISDPSYFVHIGHYYVFELICIESIEI